MLRIFSLFILFIILSVSAQAAPKKSVKKTVSQDIIGSISVIGNKRLDKSTITAYMAIKEGEPFDSARVESSIREIYATGLFSDATFDFSRGVLTINVVENPLINEVAFENNKRIKDEDLRAEMKLKPRSIFNKKDLKDDVNRILDLYSKDGRYAAIVEPKIIELEQNRINIVYEITEGDKTPIVNIVFNGNEYFSDRTLSGQIRTRETRWYRFFTSDDVYDKDRLGFDQEMLRRYYQKHGFADVRILPPIAELTPEYNSFFITYTIKEGVQYNFGRATIESTLPSLKGEEFEKLVSLPEGDTFNAEEVEKIGSELTDKLGNLGYAFVEIEPQWKRRDGNIIDVNYVVREGPRVYVESININGNVRTQDRVVRREFRLAEGDPYNSDKLRRSQERINDLDFFKSAKVKTSKSNTPDKVKVDVEVQEKSTGEISFGAGFSSREGPLATAGVSERNFLGKGQQIRVDLMYAGERKDGRFSFTEPYFMDKDLALSIDLFKEMEDQRFERAYDSDSMGGSLGLSYAVTEHLRHSVKYGFSRDRVTNVKAGASRFIIDQKGVNTTSMISQTFTYDKRDSKTFPTKGYYMRVNQDLAGVGGNSRFIRHEARGGYYTPTINDKWVLQFGGRAGHNVGIGKDIRINQRFFMGGEEVRGFSNDGIGPRDKNKRETLGGNIYYAASTELSFPLGISEEYGFMGAVFADAGTLFKTDAKGSDVRDNHKIRASLGLGINWISPVGPMRIDFAQPIAKDSLDKTQLVRFNFGTKF